jgi:acyl-CoA thioester hydrolase
MVGEWFLRAGERKRKTAGMLQEHEIEIRVRYNETDPMGLVHHSNYLTYFEMGRTELLRASGEDYRSLEARGFFIVVVKLECRYRPPARYDELLRLRTKIERQTRMKVVHRYELFREQTLLCEASVTLAMIDRSGNPRPLPEHWTVNRSA